MGETVAMVMSHYLGKTVSERNSMRNTIKRSHEARSHLIHAKREKLKYDLNEMVTKTGEYLRRALRKRIEE